jgi:uncharacterized repeat protein (TIGR02543 family)
MAPVSASVLMHGKVMPASLSLTPMADLVADAIQGQNVSLAFVVRNDGGVAAGPMHITGPGAPFDSRSANCDGVRLVGGGSCVITIMRAVALDAPLVSATGALEVSATPGGDVMLAPVLNVRAGGVFLVDSKDWGLIPTLQSKQKIVNVTNPGPLAADPPTVTILSNEMYPPFAITSDGCRGRGLGVGQSCQVTVTATLSDTNQHTAMIMASADNLRPGSGTLTALGQRAHWSIVLTFAGTGTGTVTHNGATYSTGGVQFIFPNGQPANPFAGIADSGSTFTGWTGTAPCTGPGSCNFVGADNSDLTLTANFSH